MLNNLYNNKTGAKKIVEKMKEKFNVFLKPKFYFIYKENTFIHSRTHKFECTTPLV